jgi:transcription-repair coupling factor (superfamily II helicase)
VVAPRIADLAALEEFLRDEVPEIKAVTAHGQMSAGEVEGPHERLLRQEI